MVGKTRASGLIMQFDLRVTGFEWPNVSWGKKNTEATEMFCLSGDDFPLCSRVLGWTRADEDSFLNVEYTRGGIQISYQPNALEDADWLVPNTLKMAFFSTHPKITTTECKSNPEYISTYRGQQPLYAPIASGYVPIARLQECMRGDGGSLDLTFTHNFAQSALHVRLENASVTVAGKRHVQGNAWLGEIKNMTSVSLMHTMESRSQIIADNCGAFGKAALSCAEVRPHSMGEMIGCAMTALPMEGEALPLSLLGEYFKSDTAAICPEYASHFAVHAHALLGMCAEDDKLTPKAESQMAVTYKAPRKLQPREMLKLIHTTLTIPQMSNEMAPYVSDMVVCPGALLTQQLSTGDIDGRVLTRADFVATECVDAPCCAPNDYTTQGNDCEGQTARCNHRLACLRAAVDPAIAALRAARKEFDSGSVSGGALSQFIDEGCHADLPQDAHFAYATQIFAMGLIAREAVELCSMTVGAHCATPLQRTQTAAVVEEGGHSCATMKVDIARCEYVYAKAHSYCMSLLHGTAEDTMHLQKAKHPLRVLHTQGLEGAPYAALYNTSSPSALPLCDVASANREFWIVESTSSVSPCPITGNLNVSTTRLNDVQRAQLEIKGKTNVSVPLTEILQESEMMHVAQYIADDHANVRCTGYVDAKSLHRNTDFYSTFYTMDRCMLNQLYDNGDGKHKYVAGVDAMDFLFKASSSKMTIENMRMPLLEPEEEKQLFNTLRQQWKETRMPSIGSAAMLKLTRSMQPATGAKFHCPENIEQGLRRCNIVLSGSAAQRFLAEHENNLEMQTALSKQSDLTGSDVILASQVFRIGAESVAVSHTVNTQCLARKLATPLRSARCGVDAKDSK
jgi:hypothetical protein